MKRAIAVFLLITIWTVSIGACRREVVPKDNEIDFEAEGFTQMLTTAYCVGHHTADGSEVYEGGCASSLDRIGCVAIVYTLDGEFYANLIVNDTGKAGGGVRRGVVLDVYKSDIERCREYMSMVGKEQKIWVKFVEGDG